jgi:hypothetical protein
MEHLLPSQAKRLIVRGLYTPIYDASSLFDKFLHRKSTTSSTFDVLPHEHQVAPSAKTS